MKIELQIENNFIGYEALEEQIKVGIAAGLKDIGEDIEDTAIPITPKLSNDLRESVYVDFEQKTDNAASVEVSFGDLKGLSHVDYAWEQEHGDKLGYRYYTEPGTGPRFLSTAFGDVKPTMTSKIIYRIKQMLKI
jgi:hypothetical protein